MTPEQLLAVARATLAAREAFPGILEPVDRLVQALESVGPGAVAVQLRAAVVALDEGLTEARRLLVPDAELAAPGTSDPAPIPLHYCEHGTLEGLYCASCGHQARGPLNGG